MDLRVGGYEGVSWIKLVEYKIEHAGSSRLSNYELSKQELAPLC